MDAETFCAHFVNIGLDVTDHLALLPAGSVGSEKTQQLRQRDSRGKRARVMAAGGRQSSPAPGTRAPGAARGDETFPLRT